MRRLFYIISVMIISSILWGTNSDIAWRRGLVQFYRPAEWKNIVEELRSLPKPIRRTRAIQTFKRKNEESVMQFENELRVHNLSGQIFIQQKLWLGNSAVVLFDDYSTLNKIRQLSCVKLAMEDIEGFRIIGAVAEADILDTAWGVSRIGAPSCWSGGYRGQNVLVAVLDSGVRYTHYDLINNMWNNPGEIPGNGVDDDYNGYVDDYYGYDFYNHDSDPWDDNATSYHGTHCAGTVAGDGTSGTNTGIAPSANIMAVKVMGSGGSGTGSALVNGIQYALENGADVLSMSVGWANPDNTIKNYMRPVMEDVLTAGVIAAVAAGNSGDDGISAPQCMNCPADCPSPWRGSGEGAERTAVVAVGATNFSETIASFSSFGPTQWNTGTYSDYPYPPGLIKPDICAPGVSITSTYGGSDDGYTTSSGTSMSAPHLAGAFAVMLSKNPALTPQKLDSLVQTTALELGPAGKDSLYGAGRLKLLDAVVATPEPNYPIIEYYSHSIDDSIAGDGNSVLDPGEQVNLIVQLQNTGLDATGVQATISTDETEVSIVDNYGYWGDITSGETKSNSTEQFVIQVSSSFTPGFTFDIFMETTDDSGNVWLDTFAVRVSNYPRDVADISNGNLTFTVSNFGEVGFFDPSNPSIGGSGFIYDGYNYLFGGGLFVAFEYENVATGEGGNNSELTPITEIRSYSPGSAADYEIYSSFIDPDFRVRIDQKALAWNSAGISDFVIMRYILTNICEEELSGLYTAFYLDYDIHYESGWYDQALWNSSEMCGYMWDTYSPPANPAYVGMAIIEPSGRGSVVHNPTYRYPSGMGWDDTVKYNFSSGAFYSESGDYNDDWSLIAAAGPVDILPDESDTFVYVILAGDDSADFMENLDSAISLTEQVLTIEQKYLYKPENISITVSPNPFNSSCVISVNVEADPTGRDAQIEIYDLRGNVVTPYSLRKFVPLDKGDRNRASAMVSGGSASTQGIFIWTPAQSIPSGIYLVKCLSRTIGTRTGNVLTTKKILYLK